MHTNLDAVLAELESYVDESAGFHKSAMKNDKRMSGGDVKAQDAEQNVLGGDRTNLQGAGEKAEKYHAQGGIAQEMTDFDNQDGAPLATEKYKKDANDPYNLEEKRVAQAKKVGEKSLANAEEVNNVMSGESKTAELANNILRRYYNQETQAQTPAQPQGRQKVAYPQPLIPLQEDEKAYMRSLSVEKQAQYVANRNLGIRSFLDSQDEYTEISKQASHYDLAMQKQAAANEYKAGGFLADAAIGYLVNEKKKCSFNSVNDFEKGASLAEGIIEKVAADLLAVRPIIQDMLAKDILSQEEKDALISYLSSADVLNPSVVEEATQDLSQADLVAEALLKALDGPQAANVVPEPAQAVHSPTLPPEAAPVDDILPGSSEPKDTDEEDAIIAQAALNILKKRAASRCMSKASEEDKEEKKDKKDEKKKDKKDKKEDKEYGNDRDYSHGKNEPFQMSYEQKM